MARPSRKARDVLYDVSGVLSQPFLKRPLHSSLGNPSLCENLSLISWCYHVLGLIKHVAVLEANTP